AIKKLKGRSLITLILKIAWNACIYLIWRERNYRQFQGIQRNEEHVVNSIQGIVRIKLLGKNINRVDNANRWLCIEW
ncbi:hypothetical protein ERO13_D11G126150v2, partial [Gossypium hirsutum]